MSEQTASAPDTKDWTWVLDRPCPQCRYDAGSVERAELGERIRRNAALWAPVLDDAGATRRPAPGTWSSTEYACHVRDVHRIFLARLTSMLEQDDPTYPDWDQDAAAVEDDYASQDPAVVGPELLAAAGTVAAAYDAVPDEAWARRGLRSNASEFTVDTLGRYHLHDVEHHAWDVRAAVAAVTVRAYETHVEDYRAGTTTLHAPVRDRLDALVDSLGDGARVLEIGSGSGRDADYLEQRGLSVRRSDITPGFVALLHEAGHDAGVIDPLTDDLVDPQRPGTPYDGVWANASLLHVERTDLPTVLSRLAAVTRIGGALALSVKQGDGDAWSTHASVAAPRRFVYWRPRPLAAVVESAGWSVTGLSSADGLRGETWVTLSATRRDPPRMR